MKLLRALMSTASTIAKQEMLIDITELEAKVFVYAYSPYSIYHMRFKDEEIDLELLGEPTTQMFELLNDIIDREVTGYAAVLRVETFAVQHGDLIKLIVNRNLRCGVSATLFNKVKPGTIKQFKVQLAKEIPITEVDFPVIAQIKYDGVRLITISRDSQVTFFTRNGKEVNLPILREQLESLPYTGWILDGEIVIGEGKQADRTSVSGMINSAIHGGIVQEELLEYFIFDGMPLDEWDDAKCKEDYAHRCKYVAAFMGLIANTGAYMKEALTVEVEDAENAMYFYEAVMKMGYEGLILKSLSHKYTFKRSKDWVKVKDIKTADLQCKLAIEGNGKYAGMLGALLCTGEVEGREVSVKVGSGLTDADRELEFETYVGKTIEIKYNSIIQDSNTGKYSLFLPRFIRIRYDK